MKQRLPRLRHEEEQTSFCKTTENIFMKHCLAARLLRARKNPRLEQLHIISITTLTHFCWQVLKKRPLPEPNRKDLLGFALRRQQIRRWWFAGWQKIK